jgi:large subunit ribosomal protein L4
MADIYNPKGEVVEQVELSAAIFNVDVSEKLLAQYVRVYLSNQRQGTQSTKNRSEIIGSTRKVYRQKGTGRARHGSIKGPIFRGGGVIHAPKPRDYSMKLNKKQRRAALLGALTMKFKQNNISFVSEFLTFKKTKDVTSAFKNLSLKAPSYLVVTPQKDTTNLVLSSRNLKSVQLTTAHTLNTFDILKYPKVIFLKEGLTDLEQFLNTHEST